MATVVTENELVEALTAARTAPSAARTVREMAKLTGWSHDKISQEIGHLAMQNRIEVHYVVRPDVTGRPSRRPAYTILPAPKKGGKK